MELCGACGAVALPEARRCGVCDAGLSRLRAGPSRDDLLVVGVRCRFQCRGCGHLAPLDRLDVDGTVRCQRCGLEQAFDVSSWREALIFAHGVADLAGPEPEGRFRDPCFDLSESNPHRATGVKAVWETFAVSGEVRQGASVLQRSLEIRAHPGRPLCACGGVYDLRRVRDGVEARCTQCDKTEHARVEPDAGRFNGALRATLSSAAANPDATRGLTGSMGYSCPGCGAPLKVGPGATVATCDFCKLSSKVNVPGGTGEDRPPAVWWLVFEGGSLERARLLRENGALEGDPSSLPEPPQRKPEGGRAALQLTATWAWPAAAMFLSALIILGVLLLSKNP